MSFARSQLQVVMPVRINASCENGISLEGSHERKKSIPFPPNLEYSHSHSTPPSGVVESSFVGHRSSMLKKIKLIHCLQGYQGFITQETFQDPMKTKSPIWLHVIGSSSREHVDLLGDM